MASEGPNSAGAGANTAITGNFWSSPGNIVSSDDSRATTPALAAFSVSDALDATQFGFSIPTGATITGIVAEIERRRVSGTGTARDHTIQLLKALSPVGDNLVVVANLTDTDAYGSFGSSSNLWGTTWSVSEVNDSGFGVRYRGHRPGNLDTDPVIGVDHVRITVYYTTTKPFRRALLGVGF